MALRNEAVVVEDDHHTADTSGAVTSAVQQISHQNYPIVCEVYQDPDNQCEKLSLVVSLPAGASNVKVETTDDGETAIVKYQWSKTMIDMGDLYQKLLANRQIGLHHPRILSIKNGLGKNRQRIDAPDGLMKITLPIKVQTGIDSWSKFGVKRDDGTQILVVDFTGFVKSTNKKTTDAAVVFD